MNPVAIRYSKLHRLYMVAPRLFIFILCIWLIRMAVDLFGLFTIGISIVGHYQWLLWMLIFVIALLAAACIGLMVRMIGCLDFRILFPVSSFQVRTFSWGGRKTAEYSYADTARVLAG